MKKSGIYFSLIIGLFEFFTIVKCELFMNQLPAILQEFKISQPAMANTIMHMKETIKILKILSHHGYLVNLIKQTDDINEQYQSYLIFCKITEFNWNFRSDARSLTITEIQNETDLHQVKVPIGNEIFFLDRNSMKVYEAYDVNHVHVTNYLGMFHEDDKSTIKFLPSKNYHPLIVSRRKNFHGLLFKGVTFTTHETSKLEDLANIQYYPKNKTYDITNLMTTDPDIFWSPKLIPVLQILESQLNFTFRIFIREDQKLGSPKLLSNGSISLGDGMFNDLKDGVVDIIMSLMTVIPVRSEIVDYLPILSFDHAALFIPNTLEAEVIDWTVFFYPFSYELWAFIVFKSILFVLVVHLIGWLHGIKMVT